MLLTWLIFPLIRRHFESCLSAKKVDCQNRPLDQQHGRNHKDVCSKIIRTLQMSLTGKWLLLALGSSCRWWLLKSSWHRLWVWPPLKDTDSIWRICQSKGDRLFLDLLVPRLEIWYNVYSDSKQRSHSHEPANLSGLSFALVTAGYKTRDLESLGWAREGLLVMPWQHQLRVSTWDP